MLAGGKKAQFTSTHFAIVLAVLFIVVAVTYYNVLPFAPTGFSCDWLDSYRPATRAMFSGQSPYGIRPEFPITNPPWVFLLLSPIAMLPPKVGSSVIFTAYLFAMGFAAYKMKAKPAGLAAFLLSFVVISGAVNGQIDFLVVLGLFLPPRWGLFLVLTKPQVGIAVAIYWAVEAVRTGGLRQLIQVFFPVSVAFLLSFGLYGFWPLGVMRFGTAPWNVSLFPWSILPGLALMFLAIRRQNSKLALPVSPMLSPYLAPHSLALALLSIVDSKWIMLASLASWLLRFLWLV